MVQRLGEEKTALQLEEILTKLSATLCTPERRKTLQELTGNRAQLIIDFLYSLLSHPPPLKPPEPWLRKHTLITLRKLSEISMLYPQCYVLRGIEFVSHEDGGGFCDIHRGLHEGQYLCLKVVRLHQKSETHKMLKAYAREAILWSQLDHPNIVPFYGIYYLNEAQRRICLVSPWMENGNIVVYLERNPYVPRKPFIYDIVNGLEYLHSENIIHGDLKGVNVLVNQSGRACIADFGLSTIQTNRTLGFTNTTAASSGRTNRWASPELLEDDSRHTCASDIWAFGCVCYEVLTRLLPFHECSTDVQIVRKLIRGDLPARPGNATLDPVDTIDDEMWKLINQCWLFEAADRPSCQDIIQRLEARPSVGKRPESGQDYFAREIQQFQYAMGKDSSAMIDLDQVQEILEEVYPTESLTPTPSTPSPPDPSPNRDTFSASPIALRHSDAVESAASIPTERPKYLANMHSHESWESEEDQIIPDGGLNIHDHSKDTSVWSPAGNGITIEDTPSVPSALAQQRSAHYSGRQASTHPQHLLPFTPIDTPPPIDVEGYNPSVYNIRPKFGRYFVIKSRTEEHIYKSLRHEIWSSSDSGNKRLDVAFKESQGRGPICLFFRLDDNGCFCGMAHMTTPVDYTGNSTGWVSDKGIGVFKVKWVFVRDIPKAALKKVQFNRIQDGKPISSSKDAQELTPDVGQAMLRIFYTHPAESSLLQQRTSQDKQPQSWVQSIKKALSQQSAPNNTLLPAIKPTVNLPPSRVQSAHSEDSVHNFPPLISPQLIFDSSGWDRRSRSSSDPECPDPGLLLLLEDIGIRGELSPRLRKFPAAPMPETPGLSLSLRSDTSSSRSLLENIAVKIETETIISS